MLLTIAFNQKHPKRIIQIAKLLYFSNNLFVLLLHILKVRQNMSTKLFSPVREKTFVTVVKQVPENFNKTGTCLNRKTIWCR